MRLFHKRSNVLVDVWNVARFSYTPVLSDKNDFSGRDAIQPSDFSISDWKKILWTAFDFKKTLKRNQRAALNLLCNKHVTLLFLKPSGRNLLSCSLGSQILGARSTEYFDPNFENQANRVDSARALSKITDLIFVNGCHQTVLSELADGSCVPVIGLSTNLFSIQRTLAILMTIQEKYGTLKRLKLAWIGPSSPLCNTLLTIFPSFGINIKFCCICSHGTGQMTPMGYEEALMSCNKGKAEIHQCSTAAEAAYRAHVIIAAPHPEEQNKITSQILEEADFDWVFLHPLPRTDVEVANDVFQSKNNVTWDFCENHLYVSMAFAALPLLNYQPKSNEPTF